MLRIRIILPIMVIAVAIGVAIFAGVGTSKAYADTPGSSMTTTWQSAQFARA